MEKRAWIIFGAVFGLAQMFVATRANAEEMINSDRFLIESYEATLGNLAPGMAEHSFSKNYANSVKKDNLGYCRPKDFGSEDHVEGILSLLEKAQFEFIPPISLPQTGQEMLTAITKYTSCKNLGFMNIKRRPGFPSSDEEPVPLRPTQGLGIYRLPIYGRDIFLIRGEEYELAWPSWGADVDGPNLPVLPPQAKSDEDDFLFEVDAKTCSVIYTFNLRGLRKERVDKATDLSFSEPIKVNGKLFILAIETNQLSPQSPTYNIHVFQIDRKTGAVTGKFFYSTYF